MINYDGNVKGSVDNASLNGTADPNNNINNNNSQISGSKSRIVISYSILIITLILNLLY